MSDAYIKPEIKADPDALGASPSAFDEDDIYEDAGDLEFNNDPQYQNLYLARVPNFVWDAWSKLDDDAEIQIGTIRMTSIIDEETKQEKVILYFQECRMLLTVP
jgi:transcription initiation factor TFIIF subunit beta